MAATKTCCTIAQFWPLEPRLADGFCVRAAAHAAHAARCCSSAQHGCNPATCRPLFRQVLGAWLLRAGWASHDGTDRSHPWAAAYVASLLLVLVNFVCVPALVVSRCAAPSPYARGSLRVPLRP